MFWSIGALLFSFCLTYANSIHRNDAFIVRRGLGGSKSAEGGVTRLTREEAEAFTIYTQLAAVNNCPINTITSWTCGKYCSTFPTMQVYATGGNEKDFPDWWVGWWPDRDAVVVAHQGTDFDHIKSILLDVEIRKINTNPNLFPGMPDDVKVAKGFATAHERSAEAVFFTVQEIVNQNQPKQIIFVGHSLGGATAVLDAVSLSLRLPGQFKVKVVTYGQPRVGNEYFADWIDQNIPDYTRITNKRDPVPTLPEIWMGYQHADGEDHIVEGDDFWFACAGHDNPDRLCSRGAVPTIAEAKPADHIGPYNGIILAIGQCPAN